MRGDLGMELNNRRTPREVNGILVKAGAGKAPLLEKSVGIASRKGTLFAVFETRWASTGTRKHTRFGSLTTVATCWVTTSRRTS